MTTIAVSFARFVICWFSSDGEFWLIWSVMAVMSFPKCFSKVWSEWRVLFSFGVFHKLFLFARLLFLLGALDPVTLCARLRATEWAVGIRVLCVDEPMIVLKILGCLIFR